MSYEPVWLGVGFGYKGLLLLLGLLLAYDTRNVKLKEVTDSKFVALCIYNIVVRILTTSALVQYANGERRTEFARSSSSLVLVLFSFSFSFALAGARPPAAIDCPAPACIERFACTPGSRSFVSPNPIRAAAMLATRASRG